MQDGRQRTGVGGGREHSGEGPDGRVGGRFDDGLGEDELGLDDSGWSSAFDVVEAGGDARASRLSAGGVEAAARMGSQRRVLRASFEPMPESAAERTWYAMQVELADRAEREVLLSLTDAEPSAGEMRTMAGGSRFSGGLNRVFRSSLLPPVAAAAAVLLVGGVIGLSAALTMFPSAGPEPLGPTAQAERLDGGEAGLLFEGLAFGADGSAPGASGGVGTAAGTALGGLPGDGVTDGGADWSGRTRPLGESAVTPSPLATAVRSSALAARSAAPPEERPATMDEAILLAGEGRLAIRVVVRDAAIADRLAGLSSGESWSMGPAIDGGRGLLEPASFERVFASDRMIQPLLEVDRRIVAARSAEVELSERGLRSLVRALRLGGEGDIVLERLDEPAALAPTAESLSWFVEPVSRWAPRRAVPVVVEAVETRPVRVRD